MTTVLRDAPVPAADAGVSFVMPVLNEAGYVADAVARILEQEVFGPMEVVLALGPSTDGTVDIARRLAAADPRIVLVANDQTHIPHGLNLAIRASKYPTVVRVDAHSELPDGYTLRALDTLAATRAANVGGVMRADGRTAFQRTVAHGYNSRIGLGGANWHAGGSAGPAESAYLGVFRRAVLDEVGLYDETVRRGEDWELNLRIREAGYAVWFDPELSVTYWPRSSWWALARQFRATGAWRGELVRRLGLRNSLRYFAPPGLVVGLLLAALVLVLQVTGVVAGALSWLLSLVYLPVAGYVLVVLAAACGRGLRLRERLWALLVFPTMHLCWGYGFLVGWLTGAHAVVDRSRVAHSKS